MRFLVSYLIGLIAVLSSPVNVSALFSEWTEESSSLPSSPSYFLHDFFLIRSFKVGNQFFSNQIKIRNIWGSTRNLPSRIASSTSARRPGRSSLPFPHSVWDRFWIHLLDLGPGNSSFAPFPSSWRGCGTAATPAAALSEEAGPTLDAGPPPDATVKPTAILTAEALEAAASVSCSRVPLQSI